MHTQAACVHAQWQINRPWLRDWRWKRREKPGSCKRASQTPLLQYWQCSLCGKRKQRTFELKLIKTAECRKVGLSPTDCVTQCGGRGGGGGGTTTKLSPAMSASKAKPYVGQKRQHWTNSPPLSLSRHTHWPAVIVGVGGGGGGGTATRNGRRSADLPVVPEQPEPFLVWCASKLTVTLNNPAPSACQIV